mgnify:CR=1 FL=1
MSDHTHTFTTPIPLDKNMQESLADPILLVVFANNGAVDMATDERVSDGLVGLALAELAAKFCADNPATPEEHAAWARHSR